MPYAPTVNNNSGQIMAQGIMGAGASITDAITKHTAETKKLKAYRAMAVDGLGLDAEEVDKMDLPTLEGKMQSLAVKNVMGQMQQRQQQAQFAQQDQQMQMDAAGRQKQEFDYQQQQRTAGAAMMKDPALNGVGPTGPVQPDFSPQNIMGAAARAGVVLDPEKVMAIMQRGGNTQKDFFTRAEADKATPLAPGFLRAILGPNQAQVIPDMSAAGKAVPITGPGGEDLGFGLPGRAGVTPIKTGDVTEKDQFTALQAEKRTLIAAKGKSSQSAAGAYDAAIAHIDGKLTELQAADKKGGKKGAIKYKLVNGVLQQVTE